MLFNSFHFAIFFPIVTLLYFLLPHRARVWLLLASSCWFYMAFVPRYILILAVLILLDFSAGILIEGEKGRRRKLFLVLSLVANIGMLGFFKYFNFANENMATLARALGWNYSIESLKILLPIGLSFHTFQSMSYTIEVYRGHFKAERSLPHFALYVLFYPQLVAGPIERPQNLLHQFREVHDFQWGRVSEGLALMAAGLFKKIALADRAAILVNTVYAQPGQFSGPQLLLGTFFFAVQIYCDFSGYSDMARGAAKVMGFELMRNFDRPYLASSVAAFWRRWHMSLSTWFRDYIYFPLGGNRRGLRRTCLNLSVVFLISGLWHGANWTFLIWGALHALFMVAYMVTEIPRERLAARADGVGRVGLALAGWAVTFILVSVAWVFFRAATVSEAALILRRIGLGASGANDGWHPGLNTLQFGLALGLIATLFAFEFASLRWSMMQRLAGLPRWLRWSAYYAFAVVFVVLMLLSPQQAAQPFIYFQF